MTKLRVSDLVEAFEKAIIIDIKNKKVYSINDGAIKTYPEGQYNDIVNGLNYMDFTDDK